MTSEDDDPVDDFDAEGVVKAYRRVIDRRDAETTPEGKAEFVEIAKRLKKKWADWQGEDCLHEMAFGEPFDE